MPLNPEVPEGYYRIGQLVELTGFSNQFWADMRNCEKGPPYEDFHRSYIYKKTNVEKWLNDTFGSDFITKVNNLRKEYE